ncbi:hypothetical protein [Fodinibius sediminis]|nr:hypothetical protein [Fodinibius sediminis]
MRKITQFHDTDKPDANHMLLAVDVSSRRLDLYSRYRQDGTEFELCEGFSNDLTTIATHLPKLFKMEPLPCGEKCSLERLF